MTDLTGRRGIVTGGSSGIGHAIAETLAGAGARVYSLSRSGPPEEKARRISGVEYLATDVTDYTVLEKAVNEIGGDGGIDFLVNNAGITVKRRAEVFEDSDFDRIMAVNVKSVFKLSGLCYPWLSRSPHTGRIINITSMAAHLGFDQVVPYCTSKGAVLAMTRGLAVEWAGDNITVNSIAPGWFPSEMTRQVMDEARREKILARMPLHRFGDPRDLGGMALYLLSDYARYTTGQDFAVDGGALAYGF